jgi:O-antigen/teichoic acid export membrane protein
MTSDAHKQDPPVKITRSFIQNLGNQILVRIPGDQISVVSKLVKNSGTYALSSVITPLIALVIAPFLTHTLSTTDYGILTLLSTAISLIAGITQLGLGSAFFRAYSYDYTASDDKRAVIATTTTLLFTVSLLLMVGGFISASFLAKLLLDQASLSGLIIIAVSVVFVQNLTIPSFAWLRAENRGIIYSLLSIGNMAITLIATVVFVGIFHWGVAGALIAIGGGYISIVICTLPVIIFRAGMAIRMDIVRNLLGFGVPLIFSFVSGWVLQLSDRYLLSHFSSLSETARYTIAYLLGSSMSVVIIAPFNLAWPTMIFAIAKSTEPAITFRLVFRWFGLFLLFAAFGFSFISILFLNLFFSATYHSLTSVIPIITLSIVFYGIYLFFMVGPSLQRKTWMAGAICALAAIVNLLLNLALIPHYGAIGASITTLLAYIILAVAAYIVNQKIYPIPFELGRFVVALCLGVALYATCGSLAQQQNMFIVCGIYLGALVLYGICLALIGTFPSRVAKIL